MPPRVLKLRGGGSWRKCLGSLVLSAALALSLIPSGLTALADPVAPSPDVVAIPMAGAITRENYGKGTANTAPIAHALGASVTGSSGAQNGMVSMVGSYQFNATGNTNIRGKYTMLVGQALHSSRVGAVTGLAAGAAADKELSGYDMAPMGTIKIGGKTTGGDGTDNYPAAGNNSSSAELVRPSNTSKIVKAYLVVACATSSAFQSQAVQPLSKYGISFMAPDEDTVYRMYPEVIYRDNGTADNGAKTRESCFFDVTDIVTKQANKGYGWYTVLNIPSSAMSADNSVGTGGDHFASWRLIVVEEETSLPPRMLRLKLGGIAVQTGGAANVEISGEGLSVAPNPTGQLIAAMDGTDCDGSNAQNISYTTTGGAGGSGTVKNTAMGRDKTLTGKGLQYFRLRIDNGTLLNDATSFDPAPINLDASSNPYQGSTPFQTTHNTDLTIQAINDGNGGMTLKGGESKVNMTVSTSSAPTLLSALGLTLDIVAPVFKTNLTISNLDQHYSTADAGYEDKVGGQYVQTAREGDTLRATMVCENVSDSKKFIGLQDPVVTMKVRSFKTIDEKSITAFFYPGLYRADSTQRPESEGRIVLDKVTVTYNDADKCYDISATSDKLERIQEKGYFEVTFTGTANDSTEYGEYENYAAVEGEYVDEVNGVHDDFHMAALGAVYTNTASDKPKYLLTVTAVGPGRAAGTAKYYNGDAATVSWEADPNAHVAAIFDGSSVRDDLVASSVAPAARLQFAGPLVATVRDASLANSTMLTMAAAPREVIVVFESNDVDPDLPDQAVDNDTCAVRTVADAGVATMTDSGTVPEGSDYSVSWAVKPGYRIASVEVDGVAVPFDEGTSSIDFTDIAANHTVRVLTQRVATDGSDGTWMVATSISGPGAISPTKAVTAGSSYTVSWQPQAGSTDAVLSLVKVDGKVVYDEYLNNPKTATENAANKGLLTTTFENIAGNHSVEVVYRGTTVSNTYAEDYTVFTKISGGLGTISPSVNVPEASNAAVTVTVTPEGGSKVEGIYLARGSVRQLLEDGKNGVRIAKNADDTVTVTLPRDLIDSDYTVEAVLSDPNAPSTPTDPDADDGPPYRITTSIAGGSGGKITATQIGIEPGESRQIKWESDADRHVTAVMVDGKMRDDLLTQGYIDFNDISAHHTVVVYVSDKETNAGDGPGDGTTPVDPTDPTNPGIPGNPGGIPGQPGDENYLYVNVTTVGAGSASPSVSARANGTAQVAWKAARGHKVQSVTVDGIERLDLMADLARGSLSFENLQRNHTVVITFDKDPNYDPTTDTTPPDPNDPDDVYNPDDPRDVVDVSDPASYSLITTSILGGSGNITGTTYNPAGSSRTITWAPAEGYKVTAVYVDGVEIPLTEGMNSYEFTNLAGGAHHSVEVRMESITDDPPDEPPVVIDEPIDIPDMPGGIVKPDDIVEIIEEKYKDDPRMPPGEPVVVITKDGQVVPEIDQSVPGVYVIETTYTDEDGSKRVVRLTYTVPDPAASKVPDGANNPSNVGVSESLNAADLGGGTQLASTGITNALLAQTGDGVPVFMLIAMFAGTALALAAVIGSRRRKND